MPNFCPKCGTKKHGQMANFCPKCGYDFGRRPVPALRQQTQLTSFHPLRRLAEEIDAHRRWTRQNSLLELLQEVRDNYRLYTEMEEATDIQIAQMLAGYQEYTREWVEQVIDEVRHARLIGYADVALDIKGRDLELEDAMAERAHQRRLERLREEQRHEKEMMELRAQLELVNAIIQSFNQLRMIQLTAQAEGLADVQQMEMLTQIIRKSFTALAEIDAGQIEYAERIQVLDFEHLEEAPSFESMHELIQASIDRIAKGVTQFAQQSRGDRETRRGS